MINAYRVLGYLEGISLILLVFIAVPLKYVYGLPEYTKHLGQWHGVLFLLYVFASILLKSKLKLNNKALFLALVLSCVPFGTIYFDYKYLRH